MPHLVLADAGLCRWICPLVLAACTGKDTAPEEAAPGSPTTASTHALLGLASEEGTADCSGTTWTWPDRSPVIGFTPVSTQGSRLAALMGEPVIAFGAPGPAPEGLPTEHASEGCSMGMRDDWVNTPQGTRLRQTTATFEHFSVASVRRLDELVVRADGEDLLIEFRSPLSTPMTEVVFVLHYEGCYMYAKPTSKRSARGAVERDAVVSARFPRAFTEPAPREGRPDRVYVGSSIQLIAHAQAASFDLDVPLSAVGHPQECPDTHGKKSW